MVFPSTPQTFLNFWMVTRCDARHTKWDQVAKLKLQQAVAKLLGKDEGRRIAVNIAKLPELWRNLFCSIVPKASSVKT
jgi:hypothetical protein